MHELWGAGGAMRVRAVPARSRKKHAIAGLQGRGCVHCTSEHSRVCVCVGGGEGGRCGGAGAKAAGRCTGAVPASSRAPWTAGAAGTTAAACLASVSADAMAWCWLCASRRADDRRATCTPRPAHHDRRGAARGSKARQATPLASVYSETMTAITGAWCGGVDWNYACVLCAVCEWVCGCVRVRANVRVCVCA